MARPQEIYIVDILPKNLAGKIPRKLIRKAYEGEELGDISKLDNSQAIDIIKRIGETYRQG
jgi:acetyl-CoA synthetase